MKMRMTSILALISIFISSAHALEFKCQTENNKLIIANIGYSRDYIINQFSIDGVEFKNSAVYKPTRDGYSFVVKGFKNGMDLQAVMMGENSYYTLGNSRQYSMRCIPTR